MKTYRVFVGYLADDEGDPGWTHTDIRGLSWTNACGILAERFRNFENDDCDICRGDAGAELARLLDAKPGPFEGNVDGEDYMIMEES